MYPKSPGISQSVSSEIYPKLLSLLRDDSVASVMQTARSDNKSNNAKGNINPFCIHINLRTLLHRFKQNFVRSVISDGTKCKNFA